jgi:hypothetical protein
MLTDSKRDPPKKLVLNHGEIVPDVPILHTDFMKDMPPFLTIATGLDETNLKTIGSHKYETLGTYFVTLRVFLERNGNKRDIIHHIINQSRVRVIVS